MSNAVATHISAECFESTLWLCTADAFYTSSTSANALLKGARHFTRVV